MSNQEILEKAIQKAIDGGWKPLLTIEGADVRIEKWYESDGMIEVGFYKDDYSHNPLVWVRELEGIIFNHDFAKALWSNEQVVATYIGGSIKEAQTFMPLWAFRLQQMVIADNPIEYLGEHLDV